MRYLYGLMLMLALGGCLPTVALPDEATLPGVSERGFVPFGPYETYFERLGAGPDVLMIHGIGGGSSLFQYRLNAPVLAEAGYEVFAIDLLGFGRSSRPAKRYTQDEHVQQIASFIEREMRPPVSVVANGLSAAYTIRLAAERPDLIDALVLIGPTGYERLARPQSEARLRQFEQLSGFLGTLLYSGVTDEGGQRFFLLDAYIDETSLTPVVLETYDRNLKAENAKWVILSFISGNLDQDVSAFWPQLKQPTLIIWGEQAGTTPVGDAEAFLEARPETALIALDGAKLLPNEDRAEAFNEALIRFLARNR